MTGLKQNVRRSALVASVLALAVGTAGADSIYRDGWIDFNKNGRKDVYEDPTQPREKRVADLLAQMTVDEKTCQLATLYGCGRVLKDPLPTPQWKNEVWKDGIANIDEQLNGVGKAYKEHFDLIIPYSSHARALNKIQKWFVEETRLGIPVDFSGEGLHGLNHTRATPTPAPIGFGCCWNRALVGEMGRVVGTEGRALGYTSLSVPILDIVRDPRWGRTLECMGEDPYLAAELGTAMTRGLQSAGMGTTLKHFAVHSVPKGGRDGSCRTDPHIAPREMHNIQLFPFRRVIGDCNPTGVLCSYNDWDGVPVATSHYFLTDLLRTAFGFTGEVASDSGAVEFLGDKHGTTATYEDAAKACLEAGMNNRVHFTPPEDFILPVRRLIAEGRLSMDVVNARVGEVLGVKFRLGLFDHPYVADPDAADRIVGLAHHLAFADRIQEESLVLLKNDGTLPLDPAKTKRILVTGPLATETDYMVSRYGPNGFEDVRVTVLDGIVRKFGAEKVAYEKGCEAADPNWPESELMPFPITPEEESLMAKAVAAAQAADCVIAVLGENERQTGEQRSRTSLNLPGRQEQFLERLVATGKKVVVVLVNGQPLTVNFANRDAAAILETWFPGPRGGVAIAKVLSGEVNPSGRLNCTFPKTVGQIQLNFPFKKGSHNGQSDNPDEIGKTRNLGSLYPFGYGLSYTTFAYANLKIDGLTVSCDVTNTGRRAGAEVVQLYVRDILSSVVTFDSVLRGFEKVSLAPGETKRVTFQLQMRDLEILDKDMKWTVEPGDFEIRVGASCEDIRLKGKLVIK